MKIKSHEHNILYQSLLKDYKHIVLNVLLFWKRKNKSEIIPQTWHIKCVHTTTFFKYLDLDVSAIGLVLFCKTAQIQFFLLIYIFNLVIRE